MNTIKTYYIHHVSIVMSHTTSGHFIAHKLEMQWT